MHILYLQTDKQLLDKKKQTQLNISSLFFLDNRKSTMSSEHWTTHRQTVKWRSYNIEGNNSIIQDVKENNLLPNIR